MTAHDCTRVDRRHCIHTEGGHFSDSTCTQAADLAPMLDEFFKTDPLPPLVIHFHGGLVSFEVGTESSNKLIDFYERSGAYPVCFIWESGPLEAIANNLGDIGRDPAFRELVRKALFFTAGQLGGVVSGKGVGVSADASDLQRQALRELDAWFAETSPAEPLEGVSLVGQPTLARGAGFDEADLYSAIEADLESDDTLSMALKNGDLDLMSDDGRASVLEPAEEGARGLVSSAKLAAAVFAVVKQVLVRMFSHRDHGLYTTIVEEIYRNLYVGTATQALLWNQMKKDTSDAFDGEDDPDGCGGGTLFLKELDARIRSGAPVPRIVLVGHSAGSIYICNFLDAVDRLGIAEEVTFDIVLLASAVTFETFQSAMERHAARVSADRIRLFGMSDELESADVMAAGKLPAGLARIVYPRSLPYFISALLEGSEYDEPILGMQRYWKDPELFGPPKFPDVAWVRREYAAQTVWSKADGVPGRESDATTHGGFCEEPETKDSVRHILQHGFA